MEASACTGAAVAVVLVLGCATPEQLGVPHRNSGGSAAGQSNLGGSTSGTGSATSGGIGGTTGVGGSGMGGSDGNPSGGTASGGTGGAAGMPGSGVGGAATGGAASGGAASGGAGGALSSVCDSIDATGVVDAALAEDLFDAALGPLDEVATGFGWQSDWEVQNDDKTVPGFELLSSAPLSYSGLASGSTYASGGIAYLSAGRRLDNSQSGPFSEHLTASNLIGKAGTDVWLSFVLRKQSTGDEHANLALHSNSFAWYDDAGAAFRFGFFGTESKLAGKRYWGVLLNDLTPSLSEVEVQPSSPTLFVARLCFAAEGTEARLYINPSSLGGSAPATPDALAISSAVLLFGAVGFEPGTGIGETALDSIRLGTSYGSVTPTQ